MHDKKRRTKAQHRQQLEQLRWTQKNDFTCKTKPAPTSATDWALQKCSRSSTRSCTRQRQRHRTRTRGQRHSCRHERCQRSNDQTLHQKSQKHITIAVQQRHQTKRGTTTKLAGHDGQSHLKKRGPIITIQLPTHVFDFHLSSPTRHRKTKEKHGSSSEDENQDPTAERKIKYFRQLIHFKNAVQVEFDHHSACVWGTFMSHRQE